MISGLHSKVMADHVAKITKTSGKKLEDIVYMGYPTTIRVAIMPSVPSPTLDEAMVRIRKIRIAIETDRTFGLNG